MWTKTLFTLNSKAQLYLALIWLGVFVFWSEAEVLDLTNDNIKESIANNAVLFINFKADWCPFSRKVTPVFEEASNLAATAYPEKGQALFGKVDCEEQEPICKDFRVTKYPTLRAVFHGKHQKREFRGPRTAEGFLAYVKSLLDDPIQHSTGLDMSQLADNVAAVIVYSHYKAQNNKQYEVFRKVAGDLKDDCTFYWVAKEDERKPHLVAGKARTENTDFIIFKPPRARLEDTNYVYPGAVDNLKKFSAWAEEKCNPLIAEITFENAEELTDEGLPLLVLFHDPKDKESLDIYTKMVYSDLKDDHENEVNFLYANGHVFSYPLDRLEKSRKDLPLVLMDDFNHMYLFPNFSTIQEPKKLKKFVSDLKSGKLHLDYHFDSMRQEEAERQEDDNGNAVEIEQDLAPEAGDAWDAGDDGNARNAGADDSPHGDGTLTQDKVKTEPYLYDHETEYPPESAFKMLSPSAKRYSFIKQRDEL